MPLTYTSFIRHLIIGDQEILSTWLTDRSQRVTQFCLFTILVGCSLYGASAGLWRAPLMASYVAIKMPLLILLTLFANALLNGIVGILLGTGLSLTQSLRAQLMSFALASLILGALSPVTFAMALDAPAPDNESAKTAHAFYLVTHTVIIAYVGIISNLHLWRLLKQVCVQERKALITLLFWLGGNALFGMQLSWVMRPFFGSPSLKVQLFRDDAFSGTFIEALWTSIRNLGSFGESLFIVGISSIIVLNFIQIFRHFINKQKYDSRKQYP